MSFAFPPLPLCRVCLSHPPPLFFTPAEIRVGFQRDRNTFRGPGRDTQKKKVILFLILSLLWYSVQRTTFISSWPSPPLSLWPTKSFDSQIFCKEKIESQTRSEVNQVTNYMDFLPFTEQSQNIKLLRHGQWGWAFSL